LLLLDLSSVSLDLRHVLGDSSAFSSSFRTLGALGLLDDLLGLSLGLGRLGESLGLRGGFRLRNLLLLLNFLGLSFRLGLDRRCFGFFLSFSGLLLRTLLCLDLLLGLLDRTGSRIGVQVQVSVALSQHERVEFGVDLNCGGEAILDLAVAAKGDGIRRHREHASCVERQSHL